MKHVRIFNATKLVLAVLAFAALVSGMATAQTVVKGKFQLTEEVRWGKAVLAPGAYTLIVETQQSPIRAVVRSEDGKTAAITMAFITNDATSKRCFIAVTGSGSEREVRSLNLPLLGMSVVYKPLTKAEKEELASGAAQMVPVTVAQR